jgi:TM2 domain-containing membrane protein YozV
MRFLTLRPVVASALVAGLVAGVGPDPVKAQRIEDATLITAARAQPITEWAGADWGAVQEGSKSSGTAVLLSFLLTGGGQFYNEETLKGVIMLGAAALFTAFAIDGLDEYGCDADEECWSWLLPTCLIGGLVVKVWSMVDAAAGARRYNRRQGGARPGRVVGFRPGLVPMREGRMGLAVAGASF